MIMLLDVDKLLNPDEVDDIEAISDIGRFE